MRLLGNRVLLAPLPLKTQSAGGIMFPMQYQDDKTQYRVMAIGSGKKIPPEVQPGCHVLTPLYFDHFTFEDGSGCKIVGVDQLIAVWPPNDGEAKTTNQKET